MTGTAMTMLGLQQIEAADAVVKNAFDISAAAVSLHSCYGSLMSSASAIWCGDSCHRYNRRRFYSLRAATAILRPSLTKRSARRTINARTTTLKRSRLAFDHDPGIIERRPWASSTRVRSTTLAICTS